MRKGEKNVRLEIIKNSLKKIYNNDNMSIEVYNMENEEKIIKKLKTRKNIFLSLIIIQIIILIICIWTCINVFIESNKPNGVVPISEAGILAFNSRFTSFEGRSNRGSIVRALIDRIVISNNIEENKILVSFKANDGSSINEILTSNNININSSKYYTISFEYNEQGYINKVIITEIEKGDN